MDNSNPEQMERLWRGKLSAAERADLRARPELELEARLTEVLTRLPNVPAPSNFSARVMAAIDLEEARSARSRGGPWHWRWLLPRLAVTAALLLLATWGLQQHQTRLHRAEMARSLSVVASAQVVPNVEALKNFDAIQRMSQSGRADTELLAALQ